MKSVRSLDDSRQGSARTELLLYRAAGDHARLRSLMPRLRAHDEDLGLMVLEGLHTSRRIDQLSGAESAYSDEVAGWFGRALGEWHREARTLTDLPPADPWLLKLGESERLPVVDEVAELRELADDVLADVSLGGALRRTRDAWRAETVVHGDVRFSNVMVQTSPPAVRFVDWESAGVGDSAWDVAGAVQDYISLFGAGEPFADLRTVQVIERLLDEYRLASGLPCEWARLAPFVACRLVLRAFQLVNRMDAWEEAVEAHLEAARSVCRMAENGS